MSTTALHKFRDRQNWLCKHNSTGRKRERDKVESGQLAPALHCPQIKSHQKKHHTWSSYLPYYASVQLFYSQLSRASVNTIYSISVQISKILAKIILTYRLHKSPTPTHLKQTSKNWVLIPWSQGKTDYRVPSCPKTETYKYISNLFLSDKLVISLSVLSKQFQ